MSYNKSFKINRRRKKNTVLPVLLTVLVAALISLAIAGVWQLASDQKNPKEDELIQNMSSSQPMESSPPQEEQKEESKPESKPKIETKPAIKTIQGIVPENDPVKTNYFDDAVFVGDSITTGIELYGMMENTDVLAGTGINLLTIYTAQVVKQDDGSRITIMDGLKNKQYKKVYVMLGGNEVRDEAKEQFLKNYSRVIDDIKKLQPNALIYIQSITPVTLQNHYNMNNQRIDEYNEALSDLCEEKDVYYVNVAESMKDESGMLPNAASPADGMHFGPEYYKKWFHYLKNHTVPSPESESSSSSMDQTSDTLTQEEPELTETNDD